MDTDPNNETEENVLENTGLDDTVGPGAQAMQAIHEPSLPEGHPGILVEANGKRIHVIGTAHVSAASALEARELIEAVRPDAVLVELDEERMKSMQEPDAWKHTNISQVIKEKRSAFLLSSLVLSSYQKRLAKSLGTSVGQEMSVSMQAASDMGVPLYGIDRPIRVTLMRIWRYLSAKEKFKLMLSMTTEFLAEEEIGEEELEELKGRDVIDAALNEIGDSFPTVKRVLVDERDSYMASRIQTVPEDNLAVIVGAAHVAGILEALKKPPADTEELDRVPEAGKRGKAIGWAVLVVLMSAIVVTFAVEWQSALKQIRDFTLYTSLLSALGTLLAGGHPLAILTSLVVAPFTAIHPLLAVGWFAGMMQAKVMKPTVEDFEKVNDDLSSIKGLWKNKVTRVILVVLFANIGGTIGTFLGGANVIEILVNVFK